MNTQPDLLAINERLSLALESARQVAFDWIILEDKLSFSGEFSENFKGLLIDTGKIWRSRELPALMHEDDKADFRKYLHRALKGGDHQSSIYRVELRLKDPQRGWRWVDINGKIVERDGNGRALRMVGTFSDIDERKQSEKKIARLKDLYIALSQTNQAIVRFDNQDALFQEICRIAVEHGRFHMAWVGLVDHRSKQVVPAASYGQGHQILQEIKVSIDASLPEGRGAIGTAIRENKPCIYNDVFKIQNFAFWREFAAATGFQSLASFPFGPSGQVLGALNLYAAEKDFFDQALIDLLAEMTRDISFAIDNYKHEAERIAMEAALIDSEKFKSAILTTALDCIVSIDHEGKIISFNRAAERCFGHRSEDVLGKKMADMIIPPELRQRHQHGLARYLATGESTLLNKRIELMAMHADGSVFPIELAIVPIQLQGNPMFTAFIRDISELKKSQAILKDSASRYRQLVELSPEAIFVHRNEKFILLNQAAMRLLGAQNSEQLLGKNVFRFIHPDHHPISREREKKLLSGSPSTPFLEQVWIRLDGTEFHTEVAASNLTYDGQPAVQAVVRDISERKRAEELQVEQNKILNMVATGVALAEILQHIAQFIEARSDHGLCSILLLSADGNTLIQAASPSLPLTYSKAVDGMPIGPCGGSCGTAAFRAEPVIVTDIAHDPLWIPWRDLALRHGLKACTSWPIFGKHRKILGSFALYFREAIAPSARDMQLFDISTNLAGIAIESRESEERIRYLAHYDGLTSLPNRFLFKEYLDLALRNAQRHAQKFAVFFLDLDGFKTINDTLGHDAGDLVLQEIAKRLRDTLRETDKVARMGGDEFYVLIEDLNDGRYAAEVAQKILDEVSRPVTVDSKKCRLSVSIGIVIYPDDCDNGPALLKNADGAMYRAKELGKNTYQFHSPG